MVNDKLIIDKKKFNSRLIVGTGKYKSMAECAKAIKLSGAEIVTVAVRRVNISDKKKPLLMDYIDPKKITYLPNTAGQQCLVSKLFFLDQCSPSIKVFFYQKCLLFSQQQ